MKKLLLAISMFSVLGAGCASTPPAEQNPPVAEKMSMAQFMNGSWKIKSMQKAGGSPEDVSMFDLTLSFDGETMSGKVCNNMNGTYTIEDNLVKFGPVMSTKMFCEGMQGEVETALSSGFTSNYTVLKQEEYLVMQGPAVFVMERM